MNMKSSMNLTDKLVTGHGRTLTVGQIARVYRDVYSVSEPSQGTIRKLDEHSFSLDCQFKTVDCDTMETLKTFKLYSISTRPGHGIDSARCMSDFYSVPDLVSTTSKNSRFTARLRSTSSGGGCITKQFLELWDRSKLIRTIDIMDVKAHGKINNDLQFSNMVWSPYGGQDKLLYVCHTKVPQNASFFKSSESGQVANESSPPYIGGEFRRKEHWGESLADVEHTMIGILDLAKDCQISTINVDGFSLGSPQWLENGTKILSVAYREGSRKIGLVYCNNRPSKVMVHDLTDTSSPVFELSSSSTSYHTPRVNNSGTQFLCLSNPTYGAHRHAVKLNLHDCSTGRTQVLVDNSSGNSEFFIEEVVSNCFSSNDKHILMKVSDVLYDHMYLYSLESSSFSKIEFPTSVLSLLDFRHDIILASGSEINSTPTLFVAALNPLDVNDVVAWHQIEDCIHLSDIEHETFKIPTDDQTSFISAILIRPNFRAIGGSSEESKVVDHRKLPTVVFVHGGPHSCFQANYRPSYAFHARLGLKTLIINYRGSTGVSEDYVNSLCGNVGMMDVGDCMHTIRHLVENDLIDPSKLIISGGSHGGFIVSHLSCQQEFKFRCAVIRNPVIEFTSLFFTSDIPDWTLVEALGHENYNSAWVPTQADIIKLFECSPMSKASHAHVPTLMLLGSEDKRVPMFQGERWVDVLRSNGVETLCKVYPDKHDLAKTQVSADANMNIAIWILGHLPTAS